MPTAENPQSQGGANAKGRSERSEPGIPRGGTGQSVVLVHGSTGDLRMWTPQVKAFASKYRAVAFSCRHYHPAVLGPEDAGDAETDRGEVVAATDLRARCRITFAMTIHSRRETSRIMTRLSRHSDLARKPSTSTMHARSSVTPLRRARSQQNASEGRSVLIQKASFLFV